MKRLLRRRAPFPAAVGVPARRGAAFSGVVAAALALTPATPVPHIWNPGTAVSTPAHAHAATVAEATTFHQIILPDLAVIAPKGLSGPKLARLAGIPRVRRVLVVDGASVIVRGRRVNVIGVNPERFRSWTPLAAASDQGLWTALARGDFVASAGARRLLRLRPGHRYAFGGATAVTLGYGGSADLGVGGIDIVVSSQESARLGLVHDVAALVSAPALRMPALRRAVRAAVGRRATLVSLRPRATAPRAITPGHRPTTYLQLFQASAAGYCPGLPWTVLAAIGQIESGDGANNGPSTAGALGPMQFLPATWRLWGITAFGQPAQPNIMDPYDAVPSAARYLCAAGGGTRAGLAGAIFAYNHATWYVSEVLALSREYSQTYG